jgi:hypothetical protein
MHSNILTLAICVLAIPASVTARPNMYAISERAIESVARSAHPITLRRRNQRAQLQEASCNVPAAAEAGQEAAVGAKEKEAAAGAKQKGGAAGAQQKEAAAGAKEKEAAAGNKEKEAAAGAQEGAAGEEAAAGEEEAKESESLTHLRYPRFYSDKPIDEVEIESAFDAAIPVQGGELKQDLVFTPSTVGKFEFEFQSAAADEITVTENAGAATAGAPAGFEAIEPNSYTVALSVSKGAGLTLSKIDYIFDAAAAGLAGKDVTKAQVGKLCAETGAFVISELLGELEFELEENEVTLNLNKNVTAEGQWGKLINLYCTIYPTNIIKVSSFPSLPLLELPRVLLAQPSNKRPQPSKKRPPLNKKRLQLNTQRPSLNKRRLP